VPLDSQGLSGLGPRMSSHFKMFRVVFQLFLCPTEILSFLPSPVMRVDYLDEAEVLISQPMVEYFVSSFLGA